MPTQNGLPKGPVMSGARTMYRVSPQNASKVVCHKIAQGQEQYLVRWRTELNTPSQAPVYSWHGLDELVAVLHLVQDYITSPKVKRRLERSLAVNGTVFNKDSRSSSRKRKAPGADPVSATRDHGLFTPGSSSSNGRSREASVISLSSDTSSVSTSSPSPTVYNGVLHRKAGYLVAKPIDGDTKKPMNGNHKNLMDVDTKLPTQEMFAAAANAPITQAEFAVRKRFVDMLKAVPGVRLRNDIDATTPSLNFTFINQYVLRAGVTQADVEFVEGCNKLIDKNFSCRPNMGQNCGCEYTSCSCLEFAAVDEDSLQRKDEAKWLKYKSLAAEGQAVDTTGLPKRFPYRKSPGEGVPSTLQPFYRESRHPIYECNEKCNCGPICKSRVVQKGRKVELTIFKTPNRGWGVCCDEDLIAGEFIDTYLGEVIINDEAERREQKSGKDKASYLYSLDKFVGDEPSLTEDTCYVVDGQYMGGATRFINHSCEPNCRQYTVSYNKHDLRIYDLAFFAYRDIPAGEELTFDYLDKDEEEEEDIISQREAAAEDPNNLDKKPCNCGARACRGYLWV